LQRKDKETTTKDNQEASTGRSHLKTKHQSHTVVDAQSLSKSTMKQQEFQENRKPARKRTHSKTSISRRMKKRRLVVNSSKKSEAAGDRTPCVACSVKYCDSSNQSWIQCQECEGWYHNACQGLDEEGPDTFICISCDDNNIL